jgi:hypothetical protein
MNKPNHITQSFLKSYDTDTCKYRVKLKYVDGIRLGFDSSNITARDKGHLFEALLLGEGTGDDNIIDLWPKGSKGQELAPEKEIRAIAEQAKQLMNDNDIKIDSENINKERVHKDLKGTEDARGWVNGEYGIIDVKYTDTKPDDQWNPFGWGDLDKVDYTQPKHYTTIEYLNTKKHLPWFFLVFGGKYNGWMKIIRVDVTFDAKKQHLERVSYIKRELINETWEPVNDWNECHTCELKDFCDKQSNRIEVQKVVI